MRVLNFIMGLFRRGERRRQAIVKLLAQNPDCEFSEDQVVLALQSWIGLIHADLVILCRRGHVIRRVDGNYRAQYRIRRAGEEVPA